MRAIANQQYTLEEYYDLELNSEEKWEFWDGHVWCMSGASEPHERIVSNSNFHLRRLLGRNCSVYGSNLRVYVPDFSPYRYPDLSIYCGKGDFKKMGGIDVLTNPQMIIEVLSKSTEAFDRGAKFTYYKSIPSLTDYLLITSSEPFISHFCRKAKNEWINRDAAGMDGRLPLKTFGVEIQLSEIYLDVLFPELTIRIPEYDLDR